MMFAKFSGSGVLDPYFEVQEKKKKVVVHFLPTLTPLLRTRKLSL